MDFEAAASQLVRALRGSRSQRWLSRRLGRKSNVVYTWEAGGGFPTAAVAFQVARRMGIDPRAALVTFLHRTPGWLAEADLETRDGVVRLLAELKGRQRIQDIVAATGRSRFAVSRWLKGEAEPRLPDFLRLVHATTLRLPDFVAAFVDPLLLPEVTASWRSLESARRAARDAPWSHAVLRALELVDYQALPRHAPGWIAQRTGISAEQEQAAIEQLAASGQIVARHGRWTAATEPSVDLRQDREANRQLAAWCTNAAHGRLVEGRPGYFAFSLFGVSRDDAERLRQLQRDHVAQLRALAASSTPVEQVWVANVQLFSLEG